MTIPSRHSVLCAGDCHVFLGSSSLCTCEAEKVAMMFFPGYNPFRATPPTAADLPAVDVARLRSAERAGAGWLSADGLSAYTVRYGKVLQADWDGARFGSWLDIGEELPVGAVRME